MWHRWGWEHAPINLHCPAATQAASRPTAQRHKQSWPRSRRGQRAGDARAHRANGGEAAAQSRGAVLLARPPQDLIAGMNPAQRQPAGRRGGRKTLLHTKHERLLCRQSHRSKNQPRRVDSLEPQHRRDTEPHAPPRTRPQTMEPKPQDRAAELQGRRVAERRMQATKPAATGRRATEPPGHTCRRATCAAPCARTPAGRHVGAPAGGAAAAAARAQRCAYAGGASFR